jgi:hypothetical protein
MAFLSVVRLARRSFGRCAKGKIRDAYISGYRFLASSLGLPLCAGCSQWNWSRRSWATWVRSPSDLDCYDPDRQACWSCASADITTTVSDMSTVAGVGLEPPPSERPCRGDEESPSTSVVRHRLNDDSCGAACRPPALQFRASITPNEDHLQWRSGWRCRTMTPP